MDIVTLRLPILIVTVLINTLLATVVYINNPKSATNRIFAGLSIITIVWLIDIYLSVTPAYIDNALLWVRFSLFLGATQATLFYFLANTIPNHALQLKRKTSFYLIMATVVAMSIAISPFAFTGVNILPNNQTEALPGPGLVLFALFVISLSCAAVYTLLKKFRTATGRLREQYRYVVLGLGLMLGLLITTVLIPVATLKYSGFVPLTPLYTIIFLGMTTLSIIRHQLFDIRTVVARSIAYLLTGTAFVVIYTGAVFAVSFVVFDDGSINLGRHATYIVLALLFVPTLNWLKRLFDKTTNRLFFQDAYDPQEFINELNNFLVSTIELKKLLTRTADVFESNIKSEYCLFALKETESAKRRIIGIGDKQFTDADMGLMFREAARIHKKVVVADLLEEPNSQIKEWMLKNDVSILVRLSESSESDEEELGYIVLGNKKSGNPYSSQDIRMLEIISNELVIAIQNALRFEEIQHFNITLQEEVKRQTGQLREANKRLRILDQTKDDFISMASHQMRTPLTSVKGYLSMVLEGDAGKLNEKEKKLLNQAFISSQRMVYLISDLLNVSRLKTGKFVIENTETNLAEAIAGEVEQLKETAEARNLKLNYQKPESFPILMLDDTKIRQVLMNFMDNAVHYTPSGGKIDVALKDTGQAIEFTVADNGIGVPKSEQHNLFSKFFRAGNAKKARPDGTGLGLYMAQKVIIAQGGSVIFHSEEGKGSTFGFSIAKSKLQSPNAEKQEKNQTA